ncbi:ABC transporter ATP-binding protein [Candidatus Manganitrophus noduliformans]|uniref:ABC transporter ATP-binding protein n=1 Tax=Candidatus Manganitrophus noduliformans TaxID=2606439 RepID=A0A7X6IBY4_9BACT|nr:ABC transporter ATP-binding protein [Candidatus Manganitrophus noduliformans]NKE72113.1 ABC transporter ATP-binding protein [Candidatus Manganitrophus noduliformans]
MGDIAIRTVGLSKLYHTGSKQEPYKTLRDTLTEAFLSPIRRVGRLIRGQATGAAELNEPFWALRDLCLEIKHGEVVGIIGRNGAGKSTLLKILSRITEPTHGFAEIHGRVGSLLEVGTGFHPELTGRENIYLNGAILGMKRADIKRRFDEIVDFAEIEKFLDTPVKHYSSGMYMRLAFAVAAHLEPEILMVDEVLAVGDIAFQKKCLNKMREVGKGGRTVLFVSHNMQAVTRMCQRAILVNEGRIKEDGPAGRVVASYMNAGLLNVPEREWPDPATAPGGELARLRAVRVRDGEGRVADLIDVTSQIMIEMEYEILKSGYVFAPNFGVWNEEGICIFASLDVDPAWLGRRRPSGRYRSRAIIPRHFLKEGTLFVNADLVTLDPMTVQCNEHQVVSFSVVDSGSGLSARGGYNGRMLGVVQPLLEWKTERLDS